MQHRSTSSSGPSSGHGLRVLYVEDDPDVQEMLQTLLEMNGYVVTIAGTAATGLDALRTERFHLVIADYNLPDGNGADMLARAAREGRLECESMILTGAYAVGAHATAFRVVRKPIDALAFVAKLDEILAPAREVELDKARAELEGTTPPVPHPVELVLYITEASRASLRAVRRLERLLARYDSREVCVRIVDVSKERPASFDEDRITFTPTLVKRRPGPKAYFLGALERVDDLEDLLGSLAEPKRGNGDDSEAADGRSRT